VYEREIKTRVGGQRYTLLPRRLSHLPQLLPTIRPLTRAKLVRYCMSCRATSCRRDLGRQRWLGSLYRIKAEDRVDVARGEPGSDGRDLWVRTS
jgi:hypothetical protein